MVKDLAVGGVELAAVNLLSSQLCFLSSTSRSNFFSTTEMGRDLESTNMSLYSSYDHMNG